MILCICERKKSEDSKIEQQQAKIEFYIFSQTLTRTAQR